MMRAAAGNRPSPKLGLGTVQFGMPYGLAESPEQVSQGEVGRILDTARRLPFDLLDTAFAYGTSEEVLGKNLKAGDAFRIVTKTPPLGLPQVAADDAARVRTSFQTSLGRLGRDKIYGLLVHHCSDLLAPGGEHVFAGLQRLKDEARVERIGVSVYTASQIDAVLARFPVDIIQLPINVLDQRLLRSGHLSQLHEAGIEVHARSAFLRGLLLADPRRLQPRFASVSGHLATYHSFIRQHGLEPVEAALGFLAGLREIDRIIVGVESAAQLEQAAGALDRPIPAGCDLSRFAWHDEAILDPSRWSRGTAVRA